MSKDADHIYSLDRMIASKDIELKEVRKKFTHQSILIDKYKTMYQEEKLRADLLQKDLDRVDELHYDECEALRVEIALLKQQLKRSKLQ